MPGPQTLRTIANWNLYNHPPGTRNPAPPLLASDSRCRRGRVCLAVYPLQAPHAPPVVFVLDFAKKTSLIVVAVGPAPGPEKLMGAEIHHKVLVILRHDLSVGMNHYLTVPSDWVAYFRAGCLYR